MHVLPASRVARRLRQLRRRRAGVLTAAAGLATIGLLPTAPPASASAAAHPATPPAAARRPAGTPSAVKLPRGVRQACPAPRRAGQAQCMALIRTNTRHFLGIVPDQTPSGYGPAQLQSAYNLATASGSGGTNETVAVVDPYDDPNAAADLAVYRAEYGLPACNTSTGAGCLTIENQSGQPSPLPSTQPNGNGWEQEESLDLDMVSAICPNCHILLVEASSAGIPDLSIAEKTAATSGAGFVANSWNAPEFSSEDFYDNTYFDHPGVAITAAAGQSGYATAWPASSQFVTSVGGTTLTANPDVARGWTETAWNDGGSGCSFAEPKPSWQTVDNTSPTGCLNRTGNDVAAVADPNTGVAMYDTYQAKGWLEVGGTAVGAPIIASVYALAGAPAPGTYPASYLYQSGHAASLYDVTSGSNGSCETNRQYLCNAGTGYDGPTGLGTPDGTAAFANSAAGHVVTVTDPGTQDLEAGSTVFLAVQASGSSGKPVLTYSATGLPGGLSIGAKTGRITGTLGSAASTNTVTVTAKDKSGAAGSVTFTMVVMKSLTTGFHPVAGPVDSDVAGKCLDDFHGLTGAGAKVNIWTCNGGTSQNWQYTPDGNPGGAGTLTIHGKCMDLKSATVEPETDVVLESCDGASTQQWLIVGSSGQLYNEAFGMCLADPGGSTTDGTQVWVYFCTGAGNQAWAPPASPVQSGVAGLCVDDNHDITTNGNKIQIWGCNGGAAQKWTAEPDESLRLGGGKCLTVNGGSKLDGATVVLETCGTNSTDQEWLIGSTGELINVNSGRCLDDPGNSTTQGTALVQEDCYGQAGEIWAVT